jgi:hypothetical protein
MSMILFVELNGAIECGSLWKMIELAPHDTSLDSCNHLYVERLNHMLTLTYLSNAHICKYTFKVLV